MHRHPRILPNDSGRNICGIGTSEEWRSVWQPSWLEALGEHWQPILSGLDYAALTSPGCGRQSFEIGEVLAWRGVSDRELIRYWSNRLST